MSPIKIPCRLLKTRCMSSKRRLSYPKICPAKRNLLRKNKISPSQKRSRPCQTKRVRKKKDFTWVFPTCFFRTRSCLTRKSFIRPKQNFFWSKKILSSKNKTFFPKTKFCPARTKLFLVKKDFVRRKQNLFPEKRFYPGKTKSCPAKKDFVRPKQNLSWSKKILSDQNKIFFARTRFFLPNQKGGFYGCNTKARSSTVALQHPARSRCGGNRRVCSRESVHPSR